MSNKTQLQTNNTNLDALIARVNAAKNTAASLPEVGSGGSSGGGLETVIVTFGSTPDPGSTVYYIDSAQTLQTTEIQSNLSINVLKNTILVTADYWGSMPSSITYLAGGALKAFYITG